ncbi:PulJ/GspJ family protein [Gorillibacterium sp. sgz5001074]|uniref:PulJ/GspJ family protein n=1 Tax=Gorillibacterium sp. sgz5001074 TaxID=3446695 RepID=UPI003F67BC55
MRKLLKNDRGMTLLEVMAATAILSLVLGGATLLVSSIYSGWGNSKQSFSDDSAVSMVLNDMTSTLSDCRELEVLANELRCKHSSGTYTSYVYTSDHKLTRRTLNASLTVTGSSELSSIMAQAPSAVAALPTGSPLSSGTKLNDGQLVNILLKFSPSRVTTFGATVAKDGGETHTLRIKLLKDY